MIQATTFQIFSGCYGPPKFKLILPFILSPRIFSDHFSETRYHIFGASSCRLMPLGQEQISLLLKLRVHELELVLSTNHCKQTNAVGHSNWGPLMLQGEAKRPRKEPPPADQTVLSACCRSNLLNMSTTGSVLPNFNCSCPSASIF